jgi:predicted Fe-Mo cluster-binding NifX family protein
MKAKVAIPIWNGRVSPVMDTARRLLIAEIVDGQEISRAVVNIPQSGISDIVKFLSDLGIGDLICAAISRQFEQILSATGIRIKPWFQGEVDEIIAAYSSGALQNNMFFSPGRRRRRRRRLSGQHQAGSSERGMNEL